MDVLWNKRQKENNQSCSDTIQAAMRINLHRKSQQHLNNLSKPGSRRLRGVPGVCVVHSPPAVIEFAAVTGVLLHTQVAGWMAHHLKVTDYQLFLLSVHTLLPVSFAYKPYRDNKEDYILLVIMNLNASLIGNFNGRNQAFFPLSFWKNKRHS